MSSILSLVPHRLLHACVLLALCSACSRTPEPLGVRFRVTHTDQVGDPGSPGAGSHALAAPVYTGDMLSVNGFILVPDRCDKVDARLQHDSTVLLLLRIQARLSSGHESTCGAEGKVTVMQYTADLLNLQPGTYRLRVMNEYRGLRAADPAARRWTNTTAFEGEVTAGVRRP
jgi:hypothetical protein